MKRKLIGQLLQNTEPAQELQTILPADDKDTAAARAILSDMLDTARVEGPTDAESFYQLACKGMPEQVMEFIKGTPSEKFNKAQVGRALAILSSTLTSKAGRPKASDVSRSEQLASAQRRRRQNFTQDGNKQVNEYVSAEASDCLNAIKEQYNVTRAEALNMILLAVSQGGITLPAPKS